VDATRWQVPGLATRAQVVAELSALAVGMVVFVLISVVWTRFWWLADLMVLVLAYLLVVLLTERVWVDPETVARRRWTPRRTTLRLADVTRVEISARSGNSTVLVLHGTPTITVPLVMVTMFASRGQSPQVARRLADVVAGLPDGKDAAVRLRAYATHVTSGGTPETSPLTDR